MRYGYIIIITILISCIGCKENRESLTSKKEHKIEL